MEHPKFIITSSGYLRLGMVTLHRDLLMAHEDCLGGGFYEFDYASGQMILSGKSFDYGPPRWSRLSELQVPADYSGMGIVYRDSRGDEIDIIDQLNIKYY